MTTAFQKSNIDNYPAICMQIKTGLLVTGIIFTILLVNLGCAESSNQQLIQHVSLRCEYQFNPKGIDIVQPSLSWLFETADTNHRGQMQTAYQVLVASHTEILAKDSGDLWNSGLVKSDQSVHVIYNGQSLNSRNRYFWKVRVTDGAGNVSRWSEVASWEMGLLNSNDWKGSWIGRDNLTDGFNLVGEDEEGHEALLFRKETEVVRKIHSATAYICGLGYYELSINGRKVGDHLLDPGFTDYSKELLYVTYDVTDYFKKGNNCIGVILGGGWFDPGTPDVWGFHTAPWVAPPKLLLNIILEYIDGTQTIIASDQTWKVSTGPIVFNSIRGGENYDASLEKPGWNLPGYIDAGWDAAKRIPSPGGKLVSQQLPPIRATQLISPISITEPLPGVYVYDLGVNMAGWARFDMRGGSRDTVLFFYNEKLNPNGTVLYGPHAWWTYGAYQTDKFISAVKGSEIFEPRFTYHGFRYVQVSGLKNRPALDDLKGVWVHTDPVSAGGFSCSNPDINKVQEMIIRTQLNNLYSIPTDCPHREKIGWMGDGLVTMEEAICNFEMATFYVKWFQDILDAQESDGHVPPIVPNPGWKEATSAKNPKDAIPVFSDPWWGGALLMVPWNLYQYYGDRRYLETGYDAMKSYMDWIGTRSKDYIFVANLGDWIELACFSDAKITPKDQIGTSAYFYFARLMSRIAGMMDKPGDAEKYNLLAKKICEKYNKEFFNDATGLYTDYSQLAQVIPLLFGMAQVDHSQDHPAFGSIGAWYYQSLAGIQPDPEGPGFKKIVIKPEVAGDLTWARASYNSIHGKIESDWKRESDKFFLNITVPVNTTATVFLPADGLNSIFEGDQPANLFKSISYIKKMRDKYVFVVGSGTYHFISDYHKSK